jgi:hypothetical protein
VVVLQSSELLKRMYITLLFFPPLFQEMKRTVVVGAGVIGLSTALHLLERFPGELDLTVVAEKFSPNVTSDRAGAFMLPPCSYGSAQGLGKVKKVSPRNPQLDERMKVWSKATLQHFHAIYGSEENFEAELCLEQGYVLLGSPEPDPWYKKDVFGFRHVKLDSIEASLIHIPSSCVDIWAFSVYVLKPTTYMHWLKTKVKEGGVKFEEKKISNFAELSSYDIIINCTGLGSRDLVDDKLLYPVRGQLVQVAAPWLKHWLAFSSGDTMVGIYPQARHVILGGTAEAGNWSEKSDPQTAQEIVQKCQQYCPGLRKAEVVDSWVGLRPLRDPIRLDSCEGPAGSLLVHCYGHGGEGFALSWGCAVNIGNIVQHKLTTSDVA